MCPVLTHHPPPLQVPMNTRVNLLYFVEVLCDQGTKQSFDGYTNMIRKDLLPIFESVAPVDGSGVANVGTARRVCLHRSILSASYRQTHHVVFQVLGNLLEKSVIDQETKDTVDRLLSERESENEM